MNDRNDPDMIEASIRRDRAAFASTLGALQDRVSVEHLAEEALGMIRSNAASYTRALDRTVRANPMAVAVIGAGLAWLILGKGRTGDTPEKPRAIARWEGEGGSTTPAAHTPRAEDEAEWFQAIETMRDRAADRMRAITEAAKSAVEGTRDYAAEKAEIVSDLAAEMKQGFLHGLDDLSETARESIISARQKAYSARRSAMRAVQDGLSGPAAMIEDRPLVAGAVAMAAGAALAAGLPRTETEDRLFGRESDRLMEEAARLLRLERDKAMRVAGEVKDELKDSAREAVDNLSAVASDAAGKVRDRIVTEPGETAGSGQERQERETQA